MAHKTDPVTRQNYLDVVTAAEVPDRFQAAVDYLLQQQQPQQQSSLNHNNQNTNNNNNNNNNTKTLNAGPFAIYWNQLCIALGARIQRLLKYDGGSIARDVAALYPSVRAAALSMLVGLCDHMQAGASVAHTSTDAASHMGILGSSAGLDALFWPNHNENSVYDGTGTDDDDEYNFTSRGAVPILGADAWTNDPFLSCDNNDDNGNGNGNGGVGTSTSPPTPTGGLIGAVMAGPAPTSTSSVLSSAEWKALEGASVNIHNVDNVSDSTTNNNNNNNTHLTDTVVGLYPLQKSFLEASAERLHANLKHLFPEAVDIDERGNAVEILPTLPSRYDITKLDTTVREELSYADPRQGGGELGMTTMLCANVVDMVYEFCRLAHSAVSRAGEDGYLTTTKHTPTDKHKPITPIGDCSPTERLLHDQKLMVVLSSLSNFLRTAPDRTFVQPYRPAGANNHRAVAVSPQYQEASRVCQIALQPARQHLDSLVKREILIPLCRALNSRVAEAVATLHRGVYIEHENNHNYDQKYDQNLEATTDDSSTSSFVQTRLHPLYETIVSGHLQKLPPDYAGIIARIVAAYSIYVYVSHVSLVRPLGETGRLKITQDLADLELALEQLVYKAGSTSTLAQIDGGRPYAELRSVRNLLFWNGFDDNFHSPDHIARSLLEENWIKDVRPSTVLHFLFALAPNLLSSPHHSKRQSPEDYVRSLVRYNGSFDDCESTAWMTTMACCDAYRQRESVHVNVNTASTNHTTLKGGDARVPAVLMILGPELLRRRRQ